MDAGIFQTLSYIAFGIAGVFLIISIILFIKFDVVALIGELSGRTAEKQVQAIREQNRSGVSRNREIFLNTESNIVENDIGQRKELKEEGTVVLGEVECEEGTVVLAETTKEATTEEATTVLSQETTLVMLEDEIEIHTSETI